MVHSILNDVRRYSYAICVPRVHDLRTMCAICREGSMFARTWYDICTICVCSSPWENIAPGVENVPALFAGLHLVWGRVRMDGAAQPPLLAPILCFIHISKFVS